MWWWSCGKRRREFERTLRMARPSRIPASEAIKIIGRRSGGIYPALAVVKFRAMIADGSLPAWNINGYPRGRRLPPRAGATLVPIDLQRSRFALPSGRTIELVVDRGAVERALPLVRDNSIERIEPSGPPLSESVFVPPPLKPKQRDRRGRQPGDGRIKGVSYAELFPTIDAMVAQRKSAWAACRQLACENKIPGLLDGERSEDYRLSLAKRAHRAYRAWIRRGRPPL